MLRPARTETQSAGRRLRPLRVLASPRHRVLAPKRLGTTLVLLLLLLCGSLPLLQGCVNPEPIDTGALVRYQQKMARTSPPPRIDDRQLGLLRPPLGGPAPALEMTTDASGGAIIPLTIDQAIMRTMANNLDIRVLSFDPSISREEVVKAAAEFDYTLFGAFNYSDQNRLSPSAFSGDKINTRTFQAGIRQKTITGAQHSLAWTMTRTWDNGSFSGAQPVWQQELLYQVAQPLLRDAWPEFNLSRMRVAQVNEKLTHEQFRQRVEDTITDVVTTYWTLIQARKELEIQERLLDKTRGTLQFVNDRTSIDATQIEVSQAAAAVKAREAGLLRARKNIGDVQDRLARLMADPQVNLLATCQIIPVTPPATSLVSYDMTDQLLVSLAHNATLRQARYAIEIEDINVKAAWNQTLPRLDLVAQTSVHGLGQTFGQAGELMSNGDFASYVIGLQAEHTIGNRLRKAELQQRRLGQYKAITQLQNLCDQVAQLVKERLRQIRTAHEEYLAQQAVVAAAKTQLQALEDKQQIRGALNPAFLQTKLLAEETVANAERAELAAIIAYNIALVDLARATGTVLELNRVHVSIPAAMEESPWPADKDLPTTIPAFSPTSINGTRPAAEK